MGVDAMASRRLLYLGSVYKSTGHATEDLMSARLVYERAAAEGVGQVLAP